MAMHPVIEVAVRNFSDVQHTGLDAASLAGQLRSIRTST